MYLLAIAAMPPPLAPLRLDPPSPLPAPSHPSFLCQTSPLHSAVCTGATTAVGTTSQVFLDVATLSTATTARRFPSVLLDPHCLPAVRGPSPVSKIPMLAAVSTIDALSMRLRCPDSALLCPTVILFPHFAQSTVVVPSICSL
uniref:Acetylcholinesterase n=1 Tax=Lygus hesperus TaxID=30085 RepID=A0A0A9XSX0_LYGHE